MWFDKLKKDTNAESWAVILNTLQEEIKKRSAAQQIQMFFSVSIEEARELLENTPIILLDSISEDNAEKIRDVFVNSGLDVVITGETLVKRKCFRTVWPKELTVEQILRQNSLRSSITQRVVKEISPVSSSNIKREREVPPTPISKQEKPKTEKTTAESKPITSPSTPAGFQTVPAAKNSGNPDVAFQNASKEMEEKNKKLEMDKARIQELLLDAQKENEELREIKKDYEKLKKEIMEYRSQREQFEGAKIEYEGWVRELQEEKSKLEYRIRNLGTDLTNKENQYQDLRSQSERYKDEAERLKQELGKEIKTTKQYSETARKKESDVEKLIKEVESKNELLTAKDQQIHALTQKAISTESSLEAFRHSSVKEKEALIREMDKKDLGIRDLTVMIDSLKKENAQRESHFVSESKNKEQLMGQLNDKLKATVQTLDEFRGRAAKLEEEVEAKRSLIEELKKETDFIRERFEVEKRMSEKRYKEKSDQYDQVKEIHDRLTSEYEALKKEYNRVSAEWRKEHERATELKIRLEKSEQEWRELRETYEAKVNSLSSDFNAMGQAYQKTARELEELRRESGILKKEYADKSKLSEDLGRELNELKKNFEITKINLQETAKDLNAVSSRLEKSQVSFEQACSKINSLEAENDQLKQIAAELSERAKRVPELETLNKRLENQLEVAQRHIKDVTVQREQQEIVEKRLRVQNELQERESQLRALAQKQEQLEQDVTARQELIKKILEEQESIQKEIIKAKQAQKHLQEISRMKDKTRTAGKQSLQIVNPESEKEEEMSEEFSSAKDQD